MLSVQHSKLFRCYNFAIRLPRLCDYAVTRDVQNRV